jgi:hypothetical protein
MTLSLRRGIEGCEVGPKRSALKPFQAPQARGPRHGFRVVGVEIRVQLQRSALNKK